MLDPFSSESEVASRGAVANIVSSEIKFRSGAAVTAAEFPRLKPFLPSQGDKPRQVKIKMQGLVREYERILYEIDKGFNEHDIRTRKTPFTGSSDDIDADGWKYED